MNPKISVIVSTFNRHDALGAVLAGYGRQRDNDFEIIVADDGSDPPAFEIAMRYGAKYVWQLDEGYRLAAIRNRAVEVASGNYLIFTDGDCVPVPSFIGCHRRLAEAGWFVRGNRSLMSEAATARYLKTGGEVPGGWIAARLRGDINRLLPLMRFPIPRKLAPRTWQNVLGCNLAMWKADYVLVGGFDETFEGWGHEDADIAKRLVKAGVRRKDGRYGPNLVHLWHPVRTSSQENHARWLAMLEERA